MTYSVSHAIPYVFDRSPQVALPGDLGRFWSPKSVSGVFAWCSTPPTTQNPTRPSKMGAGNVVSARDREKIGGNVSGDF